MKELLARTGFRRLLVGQGISAIGDWMGTVAFMALALELTGSATAVAGILVLRLLPSAVAGPVTARLIRRWNPRRAMLGMDLFRLGAIALVPFVEALWWIYLWAFLVEVAGLVFLPARDSVIPDLAGDNLNLANGLVLGSSFGMIPVGAGLFALVSAIPTENVAVLGDHPHALAFWVDAATYAVSFIAISHITALREASYTGTGEEAGGFRDAFRIPLVRSVMPAACVVAIGLGALFSVGIIFVQEVLSASTAAFGVLIALFGVGAGAGLAVLRAVDEVGVRTVRLAVAVQGGVIVAMSLAPNVGLAYLAALAFGGATAAALAAGMSTLQLHLEGDTRVLAFSAFHTTLRAFLALAALLAGAAGDIISAVGGDDIADTTGTRAVLFFAGAIVLAGSSAVTTQGAEEVSIKEVPP